MEITVNNKVLETQARTLEELAQELALPAKGVAVAVANSMVPRTEWGTTPLHEGDAVIIIKTNLRKQTINGSFLLLL